MSKTNLTYPAYTLADVDKAKLELLQEIYRRLSVTMDSLDLNGNDRMEINNTLSNIHKEHKLG